MDTATNSDSRANYNKAMEEFTDDVKYRLENAYELVKEEDDFRAKLYHAAVYHDVLGGVDYCCSDCGWRCEFHDSHLYYCGGGGCKYMREKYDVWCNEDGELEWKEKPSEVRKLYHEMSKYDAFDAFVTEPVKNAICEDVLGEILTFL